MYNVYLSHMYTQVTYMSIHLYVCVCVDMSSIYVHRKYSTFVSYLKCATWYIMQDWKYFRSHVQELSNQKNETKLTTWSNKILNSRTLHDHQSIFDNTDVWLYNYVFSNKYIYVYIILYIHTIKLTIVYAVVQIKCVISDRSPETRVPEDIFQKTKLKEDNIRHSKNFWQDIRQAKSKIGSRSNDMSQILVALQLVGGGRQNTMVMVTLF